MNIINIMKIIASVSVELIVDDSELLEDAQQRAIDTLVDSLDSWINDNGIPPIVKIEYSIPSINEDDNNTFLN